MKQLHQKEFTCCGSMTWARDTSVAGSLLWSVRELVGTWGNAYPEDPPRPGVPAPDSDFYLKPHYFQVAETTGLDDVVVGPHGFYSESVDLYLEQYEVQLPPLSKHKNGRYKRVNRMEYREKVVLAVLKAAASPGQIFNHDLKAWVPGFQEPEVIQMEGA